MANLIRLGGRNISEWKEDCETFYSEKLMAENLFQEEMIEAASEIMNLTIENFDLKDHIKQLMLVRL
jgi:hypothetical protein